MQTSLALSESPVESATSTIEQDKPTLTGLATLGGKTFYELIKERELEIMEVALYNSKNITQAGEALGLHRTTVAMIMKRLGIYEQYYTRTGKRFINYNVKSSKAKKEKNSKKTFSEE